MPGVSIVVPAFNAGGTIAVALESVFAQTYRDFEVIVVDDGSTDDTAQRVAEFGDRVVSIHQPHAGVSGARKAGTGRARGRFIAWLDADDVWFPYKLEVQLAYLAQYPSTGLVHTSALVSSTPTSTMGESGDGEPREVLSAPPARIFCALFRGDVTIDPGTVMARREAIDAAGGFDTYGEQDVDDWGLWLRVAARHEVGYVARALVIHRRSRSARNANEQTFEVRQRVIQQVEPLCATACARHAGDSVACTQHQGHWLYTNLGRDHLWNGRVAAARAAFREAIRMRPTEPLAYGYYAATRLGHRLLQPVVRVRSLLRPNTNTDAQSLSRLESSDLLHATAYRRTRRTISRTIHAADDIIGRLGRAHVRVLFEAASPMSLAVFRPVLDRLRRDERIQFWFTTCDDAWDTERIFRAAGIHDRILTSEAVRWMKFDGYVNTDFWNMTWLPRRARRVHMFHGVAGKYGLDAPVHIAPVIASFDRLLFPNRDRLRRYAEAGLIDPDSPQAALVGYPKVDCLVDGSLDRLEIQRSLGLDPGLPTVLYAPTWSPYSSLHSMGAEVIRALGRLGINVIVKLHDRSFDPDERASGGIDWGTLLEQFGREGNVHVAQGSDASPYLFVADALVTDHSSVGFEFMLLDRPVIVIDCPQLIEKARVPSDKVERLRSAAAVAHSAAEVAAVVVEELKYSERLSSNRRTIADELFYGPGGATTRAVQCIYDSLGLPAPDAGPAVDRPPASAPIGITPVVSTYEARATYRVS
jgi:glycosyltransferase involved in cell wall biosynthesis